MGQFSAIQHFHKFVGIELPDFSHTVKAGLGKRERSCRWGCTSYEAVDMVDVAAGAYPGKVMGSRG